ncbi:MAG: Fic family protein [Candidatus Micrarchaeota archaeon]|nr:Fic family protein [Candidatus Micrarchaeota archaeon]
MVRFTYNSNAIEGNRLTLRQTALVLAEGIAPEGTRANDIIEAFNSKDAWEYVKARHGGLTDKFIRKLQYEVTKNTQMRLQGKYRDGRVRISGSGWIPPEADKVPVLIKGTLAKYKSEKTASHPVELASWLHNKFVQIHPFTDGNGRTARFLMNWILLRNKFPPVVIEVSNKEKYYKMIEEADKGNEKLFAEFLAEELLKQYTSEITPEPK